MIYVKHVFEYHDGNWFLSGHWSLETLCAERQTLMGDHCIAKGEIILYLLV